MPRLPLPYTSDTLLVWFDPAEAFVKFDKNLLVSSVLNRINGQAILQSDITMQPTWSRTAVNGTPGIVFNGGQRLIVGLPKITLSGIGVPITVCFAWTGGTRNDVAFGIPISLGGDVSLLNPAFLFLPVSTSVDMDRAHDTSPVDLDNLNYAFDNSKPHIITGIFDGKNMILRIDGVQVSSVAATTSANQLVSFNQLAIGDLTDGQLITFGGHDYFVGAMGSLLVYRGGASPVDAEKYMKETIGI